MFGGINNDVYLNDVPATPISFVGVIGGTRQGYLRIERFNPWTDIQRGDLCS